ncbi:type II secretion system (T2SS) protein M subtype b [Desulfosoma caldarium]|uniref:Type II secretion system (T2SS) protein M subtype b n=2 Tax=Desulfosoma caldarium TaxID=610254 RepID=A0A3N1VJZ6_9BACT|nr:type II secretion system (T2SS) protein M subtype b [Desulfosoma caldarium]
MGVWGRRTRRWTAIAVLATGLWVVWYMVQCAPKMEAASSAEASVNLQKTKQDKLRRQIAKIREDLSHQGQLAEELGRVEQLLLEAKSLDDAASKMQQRLQESFEKAGLQVQAYNVLNPTAWEEIPMAQVEFRLSANPSALAELLKVLEEDEKLIRVESLSVVYRPAKDFPLFVTLRVGTLFVDTTSLKTVLNQASQN